MYFIHWIGDIPKRWLSMPADEFHENHLRAVFYVHPEAYIDTQVHRDEPE